MRMEASDVGTSWLPSDCLYPLGNHYRLQKDIWPTTKGQVMEYPGRSDRTWEITVYDRNNQPMYHERNLSRAEATDLADKWFGRTDVGRVVGCESGTKRTGQSIGQTS